ncbi:MAG TPA: NUDIX hydrolase [Vicinamibacteria bacterium]|nr:NUDIX hydrolase [Vicinamibacteria bacterium]
MDLAEQLRAHLPEDDEEDVDLKTIRVFVAQHAAPFDRRIVEGHLTASAVVLSAEGDRVLLLHHRKLDRWLQPGGHGDPGETSGETVALREALEETGIGGLALHPTAPRPLDVDVHDIPARKDEPAHQHLDLRYLVIAPAGAAPRRSVEETNDVRWFRWDELAALDLDHGLTRLLAKARLWSPGPAPAP